MQGRLEDIAANPSLSAERREFTPPVRFRRYEKHLIVYLADAEGESIVRVLHESMDLPSRLRE